MDVIRHYDLLIEENNDPVHDPEPLRAYMDKWDGDAFLKLLGLDHMKSVLEIGVGTGRLAIRTAPRCGSFCGMDISPKTIRRARENLSGLGNVELVLGNFLTAELEGSFDVIYSSLTFLHIRDKEAAVGRAAALLKPGGRLVLSLDKSRDNWLDMGTRRLEVYPDTPGAICRLLRRAGLVVLEQRETEFAWLIAAGKERRYRNV